ncbi:hypothetical protein ACLKA6_011869 [Drosophila palustris]
MQLKSKSKRRSRCRHNLLYSNIRNLGKIAVGFLLLTLIITTSGQDDNAGAGAGVNEGVGDAGGPPGGPPGDDNKADSAESGDSGLDFNSGGHGTVHEKLGQAHYPDVELTPYQSKAVYSVEKNYTTWPIHPAYNITHFIFDSFICAKPALPPGYLVVKNESILALGPKVEQNDWSDLLAEYFLLILWILLLLTLIILVPFLAVCYCCFCCCRRCKLGCPPCDAPKDKRSNLICSSILVILIIILLIGLLIAFFATRILDRGFDDTTNTMRRGSQDTCTFLQDVSDHIYHVFVNNYQELEAHMTEILNEAANHIFLDLGDASESNALEELERILDNMGEARILMKQVEEMQKELRYNAAQLRDGVRGIKRDVTYTCSILIANSECSHLLKTSALQFLDSSNCLHLDKLPDSHMYTEGMEKILKMDAAEIAKRAILKFKEVGDKISVAMEQVVPPLRMDVSKGHEIFQTQATKVRNLIDNVVNDIHMRTMHSTKSFEDIHDKYGTDRSLISVLACLLVLLILIVLIASLIFGCFINKSTGSHCLLVAIILIFCTFSIILLVSVFYFVIGLVSYQGACAPLRDQGENALFRELDSVMDLNRFLPVSGAVRDPQYSPMRMSTAIKGCMENQSIFELLQTNNLYDTEDLMSIKVMPETDEDEPESVIFEDDLATVELVSKPDRELLNEILSNDLSGYHSIMYLEHMCKQLTPNLPNLAADLRNLSNYIFTADDKWNDYTRVGRISLKNEAMQLYLYDKKYTNVILSLMDKMKAKLLKIDELILYENRNFSNSIDVLVKAIYRSEVFIKTHGNRFINSLGQNLTDVINDQIDSFIQGVIHKCNTNIGRCSPLAYIYYRGVDLICYRLVDPLNAYWLGLQICALTLIPIFFVCHRLMCLWKRLHAYRVVAAPSPGPEFGCPTCTGAPYVPPPIITCTGGQQTFCVCSEGKLNRTDGGTAPSTTTVHVNDEIVADDDIVVQVTSIEGLQGVESDPNPPKKNAYWREGFEGHGTIHEQMGQSHWPEVEYTKYESNPQYTGKLIYPTYGMNVVFNASHFLLDNILYEDPAIPPGYIVVQGEDTLALGPKVEANDWHALTSHYWLIFFWLFFLLVIIILLPFVAVCYCCFCCCHRCSPGCPPCDRTRDLRRCIICGFLLLLLILLILLFALIAFLCNRLLDRGIVEARDSMLQGSEDICKFLKDVKENIFHLFANNYEELQIHLTDMLSNAPTHIFFDLGDTSEGNALEEMERILDNLPTALDVMRDVMELEKKLRFYGDQLRDGIRGIKRDLNYACLVSGNIQLFLDFLRHTLLEYIDTSVCLHMDEMPRTLFYIQAIQEIIDSNANVIPKDGIIRFNQINEEIKTAMEKVTPPMVRDIIKGRDTMMQYSNQLQEIVDAIISDIHFNTLHSTQSFEDFYDKYGIHRTAVNIVACVSIFVILGALIVALICGCFASRTAGAACLLLAIILIFCAISFITLVGLFYFVLGIVTYHGGCVPFKIKEASEVFRKLDAVIDLNKYISRSNIEDDASPPLRMSNAIAACQSDQSIFHLLSENHIFEVNDLERITILTSENEIGVQADLSHTHIVPVEEQQRLLSIISSNLSTYHSVHYLENVCRRFTPVPLTTVADHVRKLAEDLYTSEGGYFRTRNALYSAAKFLDYYHNELVVPMHSTYDALKQKLHHVDELILYNNMDFGSSIKALLSAIMRCEKFIQSRGKEFVRSLITNLTQFTHVQVGEYIDMVITQSNTNVGQCEPLAYIYFRSVNTICSRLVDPINGLWIGLLPCALLFLPVLFVAHRLMCLFRKYAAFAGRADIVEFGQNCPACTGMPYVPPPDVVYSGGNQKICICPSAHPSSRTGGGVTRSDVLIFVDYPQTETYTEEEEESPISKRKQD